MSDVWKWLNSINQTKENLLEVEDIKTYVPYIINKSLSYHLDTILFSNEMNRMPHIPSEAQYLFFLNSIRKRKRYSKWVKPQKTEELEMIKKYYDLNDVKASEILPLLSKNEIEYIKNKLEKCGLTK